MKTHLTIPVIIGLILVSCDCNDGDMQPGAGFEIYRIDTPYFHYQSDYWQKKPDPRLDPRIVERLAKDGKIE